VNTDSTWQVEDWRDYRDNSHQKNHDPFSRRTHPPIPPARSTEWVPLSRISQNCMARDQPEVVGRFCEVVALGLDEAPHGRLGGRLRAGTPPESIRGAARKNGAPCLSPGTGDFGAAKDIVSRLQELHWFAATSTNPSLVLCIAGSSFSK
jgi:hypothetical protein